MFLKLSTGRQVKDKSYCSILCKDLNLSRAGEAALHLVWDLTQTLSSDM